MKKSNNTRHCSILSVREPIMTFSEPLKQFVEEILAATAIYQGALRGEMVRRGIVAKKARKSG